MHDCFSSANILLPKLTDYSKWSVVACDQYTSEPNYWNETNEIVNQNPSTLRVTLPEIYLDNNVEERIKCINSTMKFYLNDVLAEYKNSIIYVERTLKNGKIRHGIVGAIDLETYDFHKGSKSLIRATEGTVLERIPPRVKIRKDAVIELPHVMLLVDDKSCSVIEPLICRKSNFKKAYDFDLMQGGGHINGYFVDDKNKNCIYDALSNLCKDEEYPLLFAVGDGNHSLATAKECYEQLKKTMTLEEAAIHTSRYALVEIVNIHDNALEFEPIYRIMFSVDPCNVIREMQKFYSDFGNSNIDNTQDIEYIYSDGSGVFTVSNPKYNLPVGTLQCFIDDYMKKHSDAKVDYIHGEDITRKLANEPNSIGFIFKGMEKSDLFETVKKDGALPRKTFSMGEACEKRYYLESRRIK